MEKTKRNKSIASRLMWRFRGFKTLIAVIATLLVMVGGTFELASASQPNAKSDLVGLTKSRDRKS